MPKLFQSISWGKLAALGFLILSIGIGLQFFNPDSHTVDSANGANFNAGNIIHSSVFTAKDSMSVSQIQSFLNGKVPQCDTDGSEGPYNGYPTRADYGRSKGVPPPYICLKDYTQNGKSAAQIIYEKAQEFAISPKVLIVLLQKEQGLVTDEWPWPVQYRSATGYGCPDTSVCDSQYYGFTNQVHNAARMFRKIMDKDPNWFTPYVVGTNTIKWHPDSSCGTSQVNIINQATVALYSYTPYRPNKAALNNLYGTGDRCSSYGNRNFWRDFVDWFGSTQTNTAYAWSHVSHGAYLNSARTTAFTDDIAIAPGQTAYMRLRALNQGNQNWDKSVVKLGTYRPRDRFSQFADSSWPATNRATNLKEDLIKPGEIGTFEFNMTAPSTPGTYREYFNIVAEGKAWLNDIGANWEVDVVEPAAASSPSEKAQLSSNSEIKAGEYIISPDTHSVLVLQKDGNLVLYGDGKPQWYTGTTGRSVKNLIMQNDGNLVLYDKNNKPLWHSHTNGNPGAKLNLQIDGNLVIYRSSSALWNTDTVHRPDHLNHVIKSMVSRAYLYPGQRLETATRQFYLILQADGNLVLYKNNGSPLWHTHTNGKSSAHLDMQQDGNLVLYDRSGNAIWYSNTARRGPSTLIVQPDGNLVIYDSHGRPTWNTRTKGS